MGTGKTRVINIIIIIALFVVGTVLAVSGNSYSVSPRADETSITIVGPQKYSFTVEYDKIESLELVDVFAPGEPVSGQEKFKYRWGTWKNPELGEYELATRSDIVPAIIIKTKDGKYYAFNLESAETTSQFADAMKDRLKEFGHNIS